MSRNKFEPKLLTTLREGYSWELFTKDLIAGMIVGIVALPLSIAFGIASGVKPEQGIYTAIIAGFVISALSGSRVQIGGPTGAFIVIIYDIVQKHGYEGLALATLMAGVLLVVMGFSGLGDVIKYIPYPVTVGFTSGIALIIFTTQIRDFSGLPIENLPGKFVDEWLLYVRHFPEFNPWALGLGILTLLTITYWPKITQRVPGSLVAIIITTILVHVFHLPVETIGSRFGNVPNHLPVPHIPHISRDLIIQMSSPALAIALLAGIESLLSAVVADGMTGYRHRSNMELVAQGAANIVSPIFGGIPATGAIARTATNIRNGARTPLAGIIHAATLLIILLFFGHLASLIPMATLGGILMVVAYNMSEWHLFLKMFRSPKSDVMVLLITFLLTVFIDLTVAIEVGVVLAAFLFMRRMINVTQIEPVTDTLEDDKDTDNTDAVSKDKVPTGVEVYEITGPFFFGAADKFRDTLFRRTKRSPKVLILRMRFVPAMDATGLQAMEDLFEKTKKDAMTLILCEVRPQPFKVLTQSGLARRIGTDNILGDIDTALARSGQFLTK